MEVVLDPGRHKHRRTGCDGPILAVDTDRRPSAYDVVQLVFLVWHLAIRFARLQHVQSRRHGRDANQLEVVVTGRAFGKEPRELEVFHIRARNLTPPGRSCKFPVMRLHLVEIHDLPSCPPSLRDALTDFLAFALNLSRAYQPAAPLLRRALARTGARRVVDLCAGAGGPWGWLADQVGVPVLLTDLYPHRNGPQSIPFHPEPVDARAVRQELDGFRTLFTSFHHFRPAEARAILTDAVAKRQGIAVFEVARRAPWEMLIVALTWIGVLLAEPFIQPWRWSRFLWTYLPPVLPLVGTFDGVVSCLRAYSPGQLRDLVQGLDTYEWQIGDMRGGWSPLRGTYLIGVPKVLFE